MQSVLRKWTQSERRNMVCGQTCPVTVAGSLLCVFGAHVGQSRSLLCRRWHPLYIGAAVAAAAAAGGSLAWCYGLCADVPPDSSVLVVCQDGQQQSRPMKLTAAAAGCGHKLTQLDADLRQCRQAVRDQLEKVRVRSQHSSIGMCTPVVLPSTFPCRVKTVCCHCTH